MITTDSFTSTTLVTLRMLKHLCLGHPSPWRAALISVALWGILGWRIGEVTEVWSRTENLSDSSLMESLISGVKSTFR